MQAGGTLVSVIAVAYNSADTVLETLESIRQQSHGPIELIVCDDASGDATCAVVEPWLRAHADRFAGARLLRQPANVGVVRNLAAGLAAASGGWIKVIACDDVLLPTFVEVLLRHGESSDADWLLAQCAWFTGAEPPDAPLERVTADEVVTLMREAPMDDLTMRVRRYNPFAAPGAMFSRRFFDRVGGLDLRLRNLEDWPLWVRALEAGIRPHWVDEVLVRYRKSLGQLTAVGRDRLVSPLLYRDLRLFQRHYLLHHVSPWERLDWRVVHLREWVVLRYLGNRKSAMKRTLPLALLSPVAWRKLFRGQAIA